MTEKAKTGVFAPEESHPREVTEIARWVLWISGFTIVAISGVVILGAWGQPHFKESSTLVFNALLPLLGTWVGTVLAYYFSRKNFESASQSVERMVSLTTDQKLAQIFVEKEMLQPAQITMFRMPAGKGPADVLLKDLRSILRPGITRIPVVDDNGVEVMPGSPGTRHRAQALRESDCALLEQCLLCLRRALKRHLTLSEHPVQRRQHDHVQRRRRE